MVSSSKILTVAYGTFSCTLEGFDDSFDTMKAIAEYFRDLAQDDRYFGAEPPTPDAEMLARIAEREIARRVEARMENGSYVLRPSLVAPMTGARMAEPAASPPHAPQQAAALTEPAPAAASPQSRPETQQASAAAAPQPESATEDDASEDRTKAPVREEIIETDKATVASVATAANSVAAKLQRIRAVVSATGDGRIDAYSEDEHAEDFGTITEAPVVGEIAGQDGQAAFDGATISAVMDDLDRAQTGTEEDAAPVVNVGPAAETGYADDDGDDSSDIDLSGPIMPSGDIFEDDSGTLGDPDEDGADDDLEEDENFFDDRLSDLSDDDAFEDDLDMDEDDLDTPEEAGDLSAASAIATEMARQEEPAASRTPAPAMPQAETPSPGQAPARVIRVRRIEPNAASALGERRRNEAAEDKPASSLTAEQEADLARELAEVTAELNGDYDDEDEDWDLASATSDDDSSADLEDDFEEGDDDWDAPDRRAVAFEDPERRVDPVTASAPQDMSDDADEDDWGDENDWDDDTSDLDDELPVAASAGKPAEDDDDDSDSVDEAVERMARDGIRKAVKMSSPARVMLTENRIEEDDTSVERILDETNTQLQEPEGNRRRSAIAHLRAAVAATRADRILGRKKDVEKEAEPYRADLATVVRPRRPEADPATRSERRGDARPAPLKLVAEQRVDERGDDAPATVRPRRVIRDETLPDPLELEDSHGGFAEFAEDMGATGLLELLEAAAAYMSFVEGRDQFSRPQLMTRVRAVETAESSREDRLRSFGQLLREGKIEKTRGGRFTASERIGFKPGARAAG